MLSKTSSTTVVMLAIIFLAGCTPVERIGGLVKKAAIDVPILVAGGLVNGALNSDETFQEQLEREERDRQYEVQELLKARETYTARNEAKAD